jgi:hypothetical protein
MAGGIEEKSKVKFGTDGKNRLVIEGLSSVSFTDPAMGAKFERYIRRRDEGGLLRDSLKKTVVNGEWSLSDDHRLRFRVLDSSSSFLGKYIVFSGEMSDQKSGEFGFRYQDTDSLKGVRSARLTIKGSWKAGKDNTIKFELSKNSSPKKSSLRLKGAWRTGPGNEIIYSCMLRKKSRPYVEHRVKFLGSWSFAKGYIKYTLSGQNEDSLLFKCEIPGVCLPLGSGRLDFVLKYSSSRSVFARKRRRTVSLRGRWRTGRGNKIIFEAAAANGHKNAYIFKVEKRLTDKLRGEVLLSYEMDRELTVRARVTGELKEDMDIFLAAGLKQTPVHEDEISIKGGVNIKF